MRHPLRVILFIATALVVTPPPGHAQQQPAPLQLALVIPVTSSPLFSPDGSPVRDAEPRLTSIADGLRALRSPELADVPFAIAPSPLFCDELQRFGGRAAMAIRMLLRQIAAARIPYLSAPYAEVRLPDIESREAIAREIAKGRSRIASCVGSTPSGVLVPPDLFIDTRVAGAALDVGVGTLLASRDRVTRGPARSRDVIFVPADTIGRGDAPNDAYVRFQSLQGAAALLEPDRPDLVTFVDAMANDPRIEIRSLAELVDEPGSRFVSLPQHTDPPASYGTAVGRAASALERLRSYTLPNNRLTAILETALARARSSAEWDGTWSIGRSRAGTIVRAIDRRQRLISAPEGSVTFTSQRGSVPVTVTNAASYPVRIRIALESNKLRFPGGSRRLVTVDPPGDTIVFNALARSTGSFPVQVRLMSPNGAIRFDAHEVTVRSTAANIPALALTAGGALFLMGWYARHFGRRRRERGNPQ